MDFLKLLFLLLLLFSLCSFLILKPFFIVFSILVYRVCRIIWNSCSAQSQWQPLNLPWSQRWEILVTCDLHNDFGKSPLTKFLSFLLTLDTNISKKYVSKKFIPLYQSLFKLISVVHSFHKHNDLLKSLIKSHVYRLTLYKESRNLPLVKWLL